MLQIDEMVPTLDSNNTTSEKDIQEHSTSEIAQRSLEKRRRRKVIPKATILTRSSRQSPFKKVNNFFEDFSSEDDKHPVISYMKKSKSKRTRCVTCSAKFTYAHDRICKYCRPVDAENAAQVAPVNTLSTTTEDANFLLTADINLAAEPRVPVLRIPRTKPILKPKRAIKDKPPKPVLTLKQPSNTPRQPAHTKQSALNIVPGAHLGAEFKYDAPESLPYFKHQVTFLTHGHRLLCVGDCVSVHASDGANQIYYAMILALHHNKFTGEKLVGWRWLLPRPECMHLLWGQHARPEYFILGAKHDSWEPVSTIREVFDRSMFGLNAATFGNNSASSNNAARITGGEGSTPSIISRMPSDVALILAHMSTNNTA